MLKSECVVCGSRRKFKTLMFDQDLRAYCSSAMVCGKAHPNSAHNRKERGTFIELIPYEEALQIQKQRTEYVYEETAQMFGKRIRNVNMHKLVSGTISFRVPTEAQAEYISYVLAKIGSNKITDSLQHIVNLAMENDKGFIAHYTQNRGTYHETPLRAIEEPQPQPQPEEQERERVVQPKSKIPAADEGVFTL